MRRGSAVVGLCLLLVLSGCSFLPGGAEGVDAPGIEDDELADSGALLDAHAERLTESGYGHELSVNQSLVADNRTVEDVRRQRMRVAAGATSYERQVIYGGRGRVIAWGNDSVEYVRIEQGDQVSYQESSPDEPRAMTGVNTLEPHLSAPFEVTGQETRDGRTVLTLVSTGEPSDDRAFPNDVSTVDSYEARMIVDGEGRILYLNATAEYAVDGEPGDYEFEYTLTSDSDPGVERPAWVAELDG